MLDNRKGVCDELTSLFIAMLRSVGVPAKFISGIAYTNSPLFPDEWGPHGWAEVYFPGVGWVPYDVTYGEFGYVNPTHFKFKETLDPDTPSTQYNWLGNNVDLETESLDIKTKLLGYDGDFNFGINMGVEIERDEVKFGSYNLVKMSLENLNNYYTSTEVFLSTPEEVTVVGNKAKTVLLKPEETVNVFWTVKVDENLNKNSIYTMPFVIVNGNNETIESSFDTANKYSLLTRSKVDEIIKGKEEEEGEKYSTNVEIECGDVNDVYHYENKNVKCKFKNFGNVYLEDLKFCVENNCNETSLGITQEKEFEFELPIEIGDNYVSVSVKNNIVSKSKFLEYVVFDSPKIDIIEKKFPNEVKYDDFFNISFTLEKLSVSNPYDIVITIKNNNRVEKITVSELIKNRKIVVEFGGSNLIEGENNVEIDVKYKDGNGEIHTENDSMTIKLVDVSFLQKIMILFTQLFG